MPSINDEVTAANSESIHEQTWKIVTEKRESQWTKGEVYEATFIKRSDGLTVERTGIGREKAETFLCKGKFGQFDFQAQRWDEEKDRLTDHYVVFLYEPRLKREVVSLARSMGADIESALLNMPLQRIHNGIPVREVLFQTSTNCNPATFVHAPDLLSVNGDSSVKTTSSKDRTINKPK